MPGRCGFCPYQTARVLQDNLNTHKPASLYEALPSRRRSLGGNVLCACASPVRYAPSSFKFPSPIEGIFVTLVISTAKNLSRDLSRD